MDGLWHVASALAGPVVFIVGCGVVQTCRREKCWPAAEAVGWILVAAGPLVLLAWWLRHGR